MKRISFIAIALVLATHAAAGNLNVINLCDQAPFNLVLSSPAGANEFQVGQYASSGPFKLVDGQVSLRTALENLPVLKIPPADEDRIAVMFPAGNSFEWRLFPSRAKVDKWSFLIVNLTGETISFSNQLREFSIEKDDKISIKVAAMGDVGITLAGGEAQSYPHREPCTVIAFLTKNAGKTIVTFIPDL